MPSFDEILTTTIENRSGMVADGVSESRALLQKLQKNGNSKKFSGGSKIRQELSHTANSTAMYYSGSETLDVSASNVLGYADFDIKQAAAAVVINGLEQLQNAGAEAKLDLIEERVTVAENSIMNLVSNGIYSDGTGTGGKQIGGLQLLVADAPTTGTVGGINRANDSFWRNIVYDATSDGGAATTASNIETYMLAVWTQLVRGNEAPDLIVTDSTYWKLYHAALSAKQQIISSDAFAGFPSIKFMNADVVLDGGVGGDCPTQRMYFLNTKYIFFKTHSKRNFVAINGDRQAVNQDAIVKLIGWAGNMTMSNARLQGVFKE
jgi:hypothetical protein